MNIAITGTSGFIASHLADALRADAQFSLVTCIDHVLPHMRWWAYEALPIWAPCAISVDLSELSEKLCQSLAGVDLVVHLAALSSVDFSIASPTEAYCNNVGATASVLEACRRCGVHRILLVSTDEVYGPVVPPDLATEDRAFRPTNPYSASKASSEHLCCAYAQTFGIGISRVRLCNVYGPRQHPEKLIPHAITSVLQGRPIPVYGTGTQQRSWLHVSDVVAALRLAIERFAKGSVYNVGTERLTPNIEIVQRLCTAFRCDRGVVTYVPDRLGHDSAYSMDCRRFRQYMNWEPQVSLEVGLAATLEWYLHRKTAVVNELLKRTSK